MRGRPADDSTEFTAACGGLRLRISHQGSQTTVYSVSDTRSIGISSRNVVLSLLVLVALVWFRASDVVQAACAAASAASALLWVSAVREESVTLVEGLGVVLAAQRRLGRPTSTFVPAERICNIIINEGVGHSRVTCYLAFLVAGSDRLEVAFPRLLPRLPLLTPVYRDLHARLSGEGGRGYCAHQG